MGFSKISQIIIGIPGISLCQRFFADVSIYRAVTPVGGHGDLGPALVQLQTGWRVVDAGGVLVPVLEIQRVAVAVVVAAAAALLVDDGHQVNPPRGDQIPAVAVSVGVDVNKLVLAYVVSLRIKG